MSCHIKQGRPAHLRVALDLVGIERPPPICCVALGPLTIDAPGRRPPTLKP